jgi:predicted cupin superfamily sugar epimerase
MKAAGTSAVPAEAGDEGSGFSIRIATGQVLSFHSVRGTDETWALVAGGPVEVHLIHADGRHELRLLSLDAHSAGASRTTIEAGSLRAARLVPGARDARLERAASPGHRPGAMEVPEVAEILRRHPLHRGIILELAPV